MEGKMDYIFETEIEVRDYEFDIELVCLVDGRLSASPDYDAAFSQCRIQSHCKAPRSAR